MLFSDFNTNKIIRNAFRISKVRGEGAIRLRIPGGHMNACHLSMIQELAQKFGNGTVHLTTRQGYEIPGIKLHDIDKIKVYMASMVNAVEKDSNVILDDPKQGYPEAATRNISACIGNRVCRFANCDTTLLAQKIEHVVYPNNLNLKIAITGCPNDCIKAHLNEIGIVAGVMPLYDKERCIFCEACKDICKKMVTSAIEADKYEIIIKDEYCIKCGECILKCPTSALTRGKQVFRIIVGGRTGKQNPKMAGTFIDNASEDVVLAICRNVYPFMKKHHTPDSPRGLLGHVLDKVGYEEFKQDLLAGVALNPEAIAADSLDNRGYFYKKNQ